MLLNMMMQSSYVITPPTRPTSAGSKNKVCARIRGPNHSWVWCCTPCARKQMHCCAKLYKVTPVFCYCNIFCIFCIFCNFHIYCLCNKSHIIKSHALLIVNIFIFPARILTMETKLTTGGSSITAGNRVPLRADRWYPNMPVSEPIVSRSDFKSLQSLHWQA